eukprot:5334705-Prorocentrum_lima.AAC.1
MSTNSARLERQPWPRSRTCPGRALVRGLPFKPSVGGEHSPGEYYDAAVSCNGSKRPAKNHAICSTCST